MSGAHGGRRKGECRAGVRLFLFFRLPGLLILAPERTAALLPKYSNIQPCSRSRVTWARKSGSADNDMNELDFARRC